MNRNLIFAGIGTELLVLCGVDPLRETIFLSTKVDIPKERMSDVEGTKEVFT